MEFEVYEEIIFMYTWSLVKEKCKNMEIKMHAIKVLVHWKIPLMKKQNGYTSTFGNTTATTLWERCFKGERNVRNPTLVIISYILIMLVVSSIQLVVKFLVK